MGDDLTTNETLTVPSATGGDLHELLRADAEIQLLVDRAMDCAVANNEQLGASSDLLKDLKRKRQQLFDAHRQEKAPVLAEERRIDRRYKIPRDLLTKAIKTLDRRMGEFVDEQERLAHHNQLAQDQQDREAYNQAIAMARATGSAPQLPTPTIKRKAPKRVETGISTTTFIKRKKWRLPEVEAGRERTIRRDDPRVGNLDDRFFVLDPAAIERAKQAGEHIPNVEDFNDIRTMSR